ncbi:MAG: SRPBCC family protein [Myxococcales bacterium]|nr:SRPBCC family protein [Myxococcales bacterium]MCB9579134.1 SRPBCC family protein [Polyangiaceae bacterium]
MELIADSTLPFPLERVFSVYRDQLVDLVEFLPNVRRIEIKEHEENGDIVRYVNEWHGGGEIPSAARVVLSESMLSWMDYATWNAKDHTCEWRIQTHSFKEAVSCAGKNRFVEVEGGTRLEIRGEILIDATKIKGVPRLLSKSVSKTVEDFLVKKITPNLLSVSQGLERYLEKHP